MKQSQTSKSLHLLNKNSEKNVFCFLDKSPYLFNEPRFFFKRKFSNIY